MKNPFYQKNKIKPRLNKSLLLLFLLILFFNLILIQNAYAIGITPARNTMYFSPNLEEMAVDASFTVVNSEHKDMNIGFTVQGELKDYIIFEKNTASFKSNEGQKSFIYKVNISKYDALSPGLHKGEIAAIELPKDINDSGMIVKATVSVVTQVYVHVSYPGKYIEANMDIIPKEDGIVYIYLPVVSRGNETINKLKANIDIFDENGNKNKSLKTDETSLKPSEKKELSAIWEYPKEGKYKAVAEIDYDGVKKKIEKEFFIGEDLKVLSVSVNDFKLGQIAKIKILVENKQEYDINNSYANLKVYDSNYKTIENLKSEVYSIPSSTTREMYIYWDTEKTKEGRYDSDLKIDYEKKFITKKFKIDISQNSMKLSSVGFAIAEESPESKMSLFTLIMIIAAIFGLLNLSWFIWWIRSKKKRAR
ncbi:MAG: hypothetical protein Q8N99_08685 [Nanoarchaeota archaeon]|nr:hypothetical protein [Nanoarchaeota archaeon]